LSKASRRGRVTDARPAVAHDAEHGERVGGVTTLELFFDLVVVFTLTQLTWVLEHGVTVETVAQVVLVLTVLYRMYSGYMWLTNHAASAR
jgi:low temperature requirement protein LtrA